MKFKDLLIKNSEVFIETLQHRAHTTPSLENRKNHLNLAYLLLQEDYDAAMIIIKHPSYRKPLNGVLHVSYLEGLSLEDVEVMLEMWEEENYE